MISAALPVNVATRADTVRGEILSSRPALTSSYDWVTPCLPDNMVTCCPAGVLLATMVTPGCRAAYVQSVAAAHGAPSICCVTR